MAIAQDGSGKIVYSEPRNKQRSDATGTVVDEEFAIVDQTNVLKQIQFNVNPTTPTPGTLTIRCDVGPDSTINLTDVAGNNSFAIIQPDLGTSPTADSAMDTLTLTSSNSTISITGTASTDTIDLKVGATIVEGPASATNTALARFNGTTGKLIQNSNALLDTTGNLSIAGGLTVAGGAYLASGNVVAIAGNVSVQATDYVLLVNTAASRSITLPSPALRQHFWIKDSTGQAQTNPITLIPASGQLEARAANLILRTNFGAWFLVSNGTNYFVMG